MKLLPLTTFATLCLGHAALAQTFTINELDSDQAGADTAEFIEIYDGGGGNSSLEGYVLVFVNGSDDAVSSAFDLVPAAGGIATTDSNGFYVIGNAGVQNASQEIPLNSIQNGAEAAILLLGSALDFPNDRPATEVFAANPVDFIIFSSGEGDDAELISAFTAEGGSAPAQIDEDEGGNGSGSDSIQRNPDGSSTFSVKTPTPGTTNFTLPELIVEFDGLTQISETDGVEAFVFDVVRETELADPLDVTVTVVSGNANLVVSLQSATETIEAGDDVASFFIDAQNNSSNDGDAVVELQISAPGFADASLSLIVTDDEEVAPTLVINEFLADAAGGDGAEYVELYNAGTTAIDLSGYSLEVYGVNPEFSFGSELSVVELGDGSIAPGGFYTVGNAATEALYGVTLDEVITDFDINDFEISLLLIDDADEVAYSVLGYGDGNSVFANRAGVAIPFDVASIGEGNFDPSGVFLTEDGGEEASFIEFFAFDAAAPSATPTLSNQLPKLTLFTTEDSIFENSTDTATFTVSRLPVSETDLVVTTRERQHRSAHRPRYGHHFRRRPHCNLRGHSTGKWNFG